MLDKRINTAVEKINCIKQSDTDVFNVFRDI